MTGDEPTAVTMIYLHGNEGFTALFLFKSAIWWARQDSNLRPIGYEPTALTAELQAPVSGED